MPKRAASHVKRWYQIGKRYPEIRNAVEPRFSCKSFIECDNFHDMAKWLITGKWCAGQSFYYRDLCLINQEDAGDNWIVIRGSRAVTTMRCAGQDPHDVAVLLTDLHSLTEDELTAMFTKAVEYDAD